MVSSNLTNCKSTELAAYLPILSLCLILQSIIAFVYKIYRVLIMFPNRHSVHIYVIGSKYFIKNKVAIIFDFALSSSFAERSSFKN